MLLMHFNLKVQLQGEVLIPTIGIGGLRCLTECMVLALQAKSKNK